MSDNDLPKDWICVATLKEPIILDTRDPNITLNPEYLSRQLDVEGEMIDALDDVSWKDFRIDCREV